MFLPGLLFSIDAHQSPASPRQQQQQPHDQPFAPDDVDSPSAPAPGTAVLEVYTSSSRVTDEAPAESTLQDEFKVEPWEENECNMKEDEETVAFDVHPDEMDISDDDTGGEYQEGNEELERLRDVIGGGSDRSATDAGSEDGDVDAADPSQEGAEAEWVM